MSDKAVCGHLKNTPLSGEGGLGGDHGHPDQHGHHEQDDSHVPIHFVGLSAAKKVKECFLRLLRAACTNVLTLTVKNFNSS